MDTKTHTLTQFINRRFTVIYIVLLFITAPLIYFMSVTQMEQESQVELNQLLTAVEKLSPEVLNSDLGNFDEKSETILAFLSEHNGLFYLPVSVDDITTKSQFSSDNVQILNQFITSKDKSPVSGQITNGRDELIYRAYPMMERTSLNGFVLIGIVKDKFSKAIIVRVATFLGLMTIVFAFIISTINTSLRTHVINPLIRIKNRTKSVANGEIDKVFKSDRNDEVGELIKSIELLRRSLSISVNMIKSQTKKKPETK